MTNSKLTTKLRCALLRGGSTHRYRVMVRAAKTAGVSESMHTYGITADRDEIKALAANGEVVSVDLSESTRLL